MRSFAFSWWVALGACLLLGASAHADARGEAQQHYRRGVEHYALGEFIAAAREYEAAFRLRQLPELLYDAAQSYRRAGELNKAVTLYRNYVILYPREPNTERTRELIGRLERQLEAEKQKATPPPAATPPPTAQPLPPAPAAAVTPPEAPPPQDTPPSTPLYKKWWLWTIVGVVVTGAVVGGAVGATQSSPSWSSVPAIGPGAH